MVSPAVAGVVFCVDRLSAVESVHCRNFPNVEMTAIKLILVFVFAYRHLQGLQF